MVLRDYVMAYWPRAVDEPSEIPYLRGYIILNLVVFVQVSRCLLI
jgi:hypothetical protein